MKHIKFDVNLTGFKFNDLEVLPEPVKQWALGIAGKALELALNENVREEFCVLYDYEESTDFFDPSTISFILDLSSEIDCPIFEISLKKILKQNLEDDCFSEDGLKSLKKVFEDLIDDIDQALGDLSL